MSPRRLLGPVRALLLIVGLLAFAAALDTVATMPPEPTDSDGFVHGLAYAFSLAIGVAGLLVAQIGYAVPAGTGRFRFGPLADRRVGVRAGVAALVHFPVALLLIYAVPAVVPGVTESTTYAVALFAVALAGLLGVALAVLFGLVGLLVSAGRRRRGSDGEAAS